MCTQVCVFAPMYMGMAGEHMLVHMPYLRPSQSCIQVKQATTLVPSKRR